MTSRVDVILLVVGTLHMTSRFSLLAPYPTERLDVILHQKVLIIPTVTIEENQKQLVCLIRLCYNSPDS
jgi:hypothetical protein